MSDTLMISVSGMRGIVGTDLTPELVARHAAALGAWVRGNGGTRVVLGRDARTSGEMFARAATSGFQSVGVDVIDVGVAPTPTVQMAVEHHHAGAGLILTASHNPIEWNALKFVGPDGIFLDAAAGAAVRAFADAGPTRADWSAIGALSHDAGAIARHLDAIFALPQIDAAAIREREFHVALDCVRGAGGPTMLALFDRLGVRVSGHQPRSRRSLSPRARTDSRKPRPAGGTCATDRRRHRDGGRPGRRSARPRRRDRPADRRGLHPCHRHSGGAGSHGTAEGIAGRRRQPVDLARGRRRGIPGGRQVRPRPGRRGQRCPDDRGGTRPDWRGRGTAA